MKQYLLILAVSIACFTSRAQDNVYPAEPYNGLLFITNGTIHVGNGTVIENGTIQINNGKIVNVGTNIPVPADDVKVFNAQGKHVYPGLILPQSDLGLKEIGAGVRGSNDYRELGEYNSNIRSIVAYNTASTMINVLRSNGILLANVVPQGGVVSGSSSVVQLDAWNYEDAAYRTDVGMHINIPTPPPAGAKDNSTDKVAELKQFFREAKAYLQESSHDVTNLKFEALRNLFDKKQKLFVHTDQVKQMYVAVELAKEFGFTVVIVGGADSWQIAPLLKENNVAVILNAEHSLPATEDSDVDEPYKTPALLQKAGVLFALNDHASNTRYRNLAFNAGTAATYGLGKEEALAAITLNAAKILGIDATTGSLEVGKDANIIISEGDVLDMKSSVISQAFIQGRQLNLENKQTQLNQRYLKKYGL